MFAAEVFSQTKILGAEILRHSLHFRQKPAENDELNAFFTNCHALNFLEWPWRATMSFVAKSQSDQPSLRFLKPLRTTPAANSNVRCRWITWMG